MSDTTSAATQPPGSHLDSLTSPQFLISVYGLTIASLALLGCFLRSDIPLAVLTGLVGTVIGAGFTTVLNFYVGSSASSQRKDDRATGVTP